ncbi:MAG: hypothetical protein WA871_12915 [Candidatus Acidiferrales bacterium]
MRIKSGTRASAANVWTAFDVRAILTERGWFGDDLNLDSDSSSSPAGKWVADAAAWLGPYAADCDALAALLSLVFRYDAREIIESSDAHAVLLRQGARDAIRALGVEVLDGSPIDSVRFSEIVAAVKQRSGVSGRPLFHSIRLALAGRAGEGELDRVILLLDTAAAAPGFAPVKTARERMLEFCGVLD